MYGLYPLNPHADYAIWEIGNGYFKTTDDLAPYEGKTLVYYNYFNGGCGTLDLSGKIYQIAYEALQ